MSKRNYYTLAVYDEASGLWCAEFGDYDHATVEYEAQDIRYSPSHPKKAKHIKILTTACNDVAIKAAIDALNKKKDK